MYGIKVNGKNYGYGKYAPKAKVGDTVTFGVVYRGEYANVDTKNIQIVANGNGTAPPDAGTPTKQFAPKGAGGMSKDDYWDRKEAKDEARQVIISKQSALNSAPQFVSLMVSTGALPAPTKAKDATSILEGAVKHYRDLFYLDATGVAMTSENAGTAAPEPAGVDDAEEDEGNSGW